MVLHCRWADGNASPGVRADDRCRVLLRLGRLVEPTGGAAAASLGANTLGGVGADIHSARQEGSQAYARDVPAALG